MQIKTMRQRRLLEFFIKNGNRATVRELHNISCNNPPQLIAQLRRHGWQIDCEDTPFVNADRSKSHFGVYSLSDESLAEAKQLLSIKVVICAEA